MSSRASAPFSALGPPSSTHCVARRYFPSFVGRHGPQPFSQRFHLHEIIPSISFGVSVLPCSARAHRRFTNAICSTLAPFAASKQGAAKTSAKAFARDTATLIRSRDSKNSMPRGISSPEEAVMETRQTGASASVYFLLHMGTKYGLILYTPPDSRRNLDIFLNVFQGLCEHGHTPTAGAEKSSQNRIWHHFD
jgi:hypothetical protein